VGPLNHLNRWSSCERADSIDSAPVGWELDCEPRRRLAVCERSLIASSKLFQYHI
jgi:hypothetical protein